LATGAICCGATFPTIGNSDKPFEPERYKTSKYWGDELQAVMDATGLKRPVLVGWSYAGRVMADYLTTHGTAKLAGLNYVDANQKGDPTFIGPNVRSNLPLMASEDLATNIAATRAFLHGCFSIQPTPEEYEIMLAFNMMVPPKVRLGLSNRPLEVDDMLRGLKLPVLVTHGAEDKNTNLIAAEYTAKMVTPSTHVVGVRDNRSDPNSASAARIASAQRTGSQGRATSARSSVSVAGLANTATAMNVRPQIPTTDAPCASSSGLASA
jgi:pimeloyl-ACP methyl ester carboxylesterase